MRKWIEALLRAYPDLSPCAESVEQAFDTLADAFRGGRKLLVCGNGGSAADCEHIVGELMKAFTLPRPVPLPVREALARLPHGAYLAEHLERGLPAVSLVSQSALFTAYVNDARADLVFAQQVYGYGVPGDVLMGISTSGNSRNVVYALELAGALGVRTIGLTGNSGGAMAGCCDVLIRVPYTETAQVQERHLPVYHALCAALEEEFFSP